MSKHFKKDLENYEFLGDAVFEVYVTANVFNFTRKRKLLEKFSDNMEHEI